MKEDERFVLQLHSFSPAPSAPMLLQLPTVLCDPLLLVLLLPLLPHIPSEAASPSSSSCAADAAACRRDW
jgi:hypothetical protein